jgi:hypothetical protein
MVCEESVLKTAIIYSVPSSPGYTIITIVRIIIIILNIIIFKY